MQFLHNLPLSDRAIYFKKNSKVRRLITRVYVTSKAFSMPGSAKNKGKRLADLISIPARLP